MAHVSHDEFLFTLASNITHILMAIVLARSAGSALIAHEASRQRPVLDMHT